MSKYTWHGWIHYDGDGESIFRELTFDVTEDMYRQIQEAIAAKKPLTSCNCYNELENRLIEAFDCSDFIGEFPPDPDDFEDQEEFEEALDEYRDAKASFDERYYLANADVYDPTDEWKVKQQFIGRYCVNLDHGRAGVFDVECEEDGEWGGRTARNSMRVSYDSHGVITDVFDFSATAMEWAGIQRDGWDSCCPAYGLLADELEEQLSQDQADDDDED